MTLITRDEWGFAGPLGEPMLLPARGVFIHHTVTRVTSDPHADMRHVEHIGHQRFGLLSYSFCSHPRLPGAILEGQGLHRGAHTARRNSRYFGIALIGNYTSREISSRQVEDIAALIRQLVAAGHLVADPAIRPHSDVKATDCPGGSTFAALPRIRHLVTHPPTHHDHRQEVEMLIVKEADSHRHWLAHAGGRDYIADPDDLEALARIIPVVVMPSQRIGRYWPAR